MRQGTLKVTRYSYLAIITIAFLLFSNVVNAEIFPLPSNGDVIGQVSIVKAKHGETLLDVGRRFGAGMDEIIAANPRINQIQYLGFGKKVLIPSQYILPATARVGIIINLAELRLYYFPPGKNFVITEPVGIGRDNDSEWFTPTGFTEVIEKQKDPSWYPPESVREEAARNGTPIPKKFPPGKENPLGGYMLRLGWWSYLIHGTIRPEGVGSRVSAGCIRMYPESIETLYHLVAIGTPVRIINEPFKTGWLNGKLYFEAHKPLLEDEDKYTIDFASVVQQVNRKAQQRHHVTIKWSVIEKATKRSSGIPQIVG